MTRGHESEKAAAEPLSARALVRIWRRIADGICWILGVESACQFQLVMIMLAMRADAVTVTLRNCSDISIYSALCTPRSAIRCGATLETFATVDFLC